MRLLDPPGDSQLLIRTAAFQLLLRHAGPATQAAVLFRPDDALLAACANVYADWCPNSNLFASAHEAEGWARSHAVSGRILSLAEASDLGSVEWADVVARRLRADAD